jgi:hypothetical protein
VLPVCGISGYTRRVAAEAGAGSTIRVKRKTSKYAVRVTGIGNFPFVYIYKQIFPVFMNPPPTFECNEQRITQGVGFPVVFVCPILNDRY